MIDEYTTINSVGEGFYSEKRSKFLAFAHHVTSKDEVKVLLKSYQEKYYDARHVCYAYILGPEQKDFRAVDNGEPSSTAGKPIMGQILSHGLTDVVVYVIRYYGGVNLGTGGLIRAYRTAADDALNHSVTAVKQVEEFIVWHFTYPMINAVMHIVKEMNLRIVSQDFDTDCSIKLAVRKSDAEILRRRL
ncbi:MAG: YigZ family protein, partial [Prevotella sp.]